MTGCSVIFCCLLLCLAVKRAAHAERKNSEQIVGRTKEHSNTVGGKSQGPRALYRDHSLIKQIGTIVLLGVGLLLWYALLTPAQSAAETASEKGSTVRNVRIAMCQTLCIDGDRDGNFIRLENALKRAAEMKAQIACFPETCILGWVNPDAHQLAHPIPGTKPRHDVQRLSTLAQRYGMMISVGLAEKNGDSLHDSVVLIDRDGSLLLVHRKINTLPGLMIPPYTPGDDIRVAQTRFGKIGLLICADTFVEEHLLELRRQGPDVVLVPFGWAARKEEWPDHGKELAKAVAKAAKMIGAPVVGVDLVGEITHGPWRGRTYGGQSVTSDAVGNILTVARDRDVQVVVVELPLPTQ